jgi:hypothetical protein
MDKYTYYVIVNIYNLAFVDLRGYAVSKIKDARKFTTYASAKQELETFDEPKDFRIYLAEERVEVDFELIESEDK